MRTAVGAANVLSGRRRRRSCRAACSRTMTRQGVPTIATYNAMGYNAATFGNHEFDWGQTVLGDRTAAGDLSLRDRQHRAERYRQLRHRRLDDTRLSRMRPIEILTVGTAPNTVKVAFIGVTTAETPTITVAAATAGLCFKDPAESIIHYYDAMKAAGADVIVVLSHLGYTDGGYGYGIPVYGDQTLAQQAEHRRQARQPDHRRSQPHRPVPPPRSVGNTTVVQAHYNGRKVGRADITVDTGRRRVDRHAGPRIDRSAPPTPKTPPSRRWSPPTPPIPPTWRSINTADRLHRRSTCCATTTATT
ncbi:MAG: hypothetical protein MZV64_23875 [Ignavibacteriales bacterium]|nr:hypothetical protein [Ignavibacteriales bacterium]